MQLDMYDDRGALLKEYYPEMSDLPKWVVDGLRGHQFSAGEKLASEDFAVTIPLRDGVKNAYPIHNDAMTAVSCLYFDHTHQMLPLDLQKQAAANLLDACEQYEIEASDTVAQLGTEYQEEKTAAKPLKKPFQSQGIDGSSLFPLGTPEQVKTASLLYDKILNKLSPDQRREFSVNLREKAAEFSVDLPSSVERWGGDRLSVLAVREALEKRAAYMSEPQLDLLRKSADRIMELHPDKVAELLEDMDTDLGIDSLWGRGIPDPRAIYEATKVASMVKVAEGVNIPEEAWNDACDKGILDALDPSLQGALKRNPELLEQYEGHPVHEHILGGLESLGMIERV